MEREQVLGVLSGKTEDEIIEIALQTRPDGDASIQFRYRQWAEDIGWYTQKTVEIGDDQIPELIGILEKQRLSQPRRPGDGPNIVPFARRYGT